MTQRDLGFVRKLGKPKLTCRTLHHTLEIKYWGPASGIRDFKSPYGPSIIVRQSVCTRCGFRQEKFYNPTNANRAVMGLTFTAFKTRYRYPGDYLWKSGESSKEKPTKADYSFELYTRMNEEKKNASR